MSEQRRQKEPVLAALLNLLTGGVGYLYLGQMAKGVVIIACQILFGSMAACLAFLPTGLAEMGMTYAGCCLSLAPLFFAGLIALSTAWDGYRLAQRVNEGHTLGNWEFFLGRKQAGPAACRSRIPFRRLGRARQAFGPRACLYPLGPVANGRPSPTCLPPRQ